MLVTDPCPARQVSQISAERRAHQLKTTGKQPKDGEPKIKKQLN